MGTKCDTCQHSYMNNKTGKVCRKNCTSNNEHFESIHSITEILIQCPNPECKDHKEPYKVQNPLKTMITCMWCGAIYTPYLHQTIMPEYIRQ